ncbi:hypothetical protein SAY87_024587 [Trapa incisa]|uniref:Uncharacterized protein n=1 Tax=Trapa incisa TaxID=236973 RepID=A0AAN7GPG9_9MYRT|nr:hypothetical protein SAY87_024587 [Trapa incisa]
MNKLTRASTPRVRKGKHEIKKIIYWPKTETTHQSQFVSLNYGPIGPYDLPSASLAGTGSRARSRRPHPAKTTYRGRAPRLLRFAESSSHISLSLLQEPEIAYL